MAQQGSGRDTRDAFVLFLQGTEREKQRIRSLRRFGYAPPGSRDEELIAGLEAALDQAAGSMNVTGLPAAAPGERPASDSRVPMRNPDLKGPLTPTTDWVEEKAGADAARLAIASLPNGEDVAYEIVNFVDGKRTVADIRDAVSAEFEPIDRAAVTEYLELLVRIGAIRWR